MRTSRSMLLRALIALATAGLLIAACGPPPGPTPEQICGATGCDACAGFQCPGTDAGVH